MMLSVWQHEIFSTQLVFFFFFNNKTLLKHKGTRRASWKEQHATAASSTKRKIKNRKNKHLAQTENRGAKKPDQNQHQNSPNNNRMQNSQQNSPSPANADKDCTTQPTTLPRYTKSRIPTPLIIQKRNPLQPAQAPFPRKTWTLSNNSPTSFARSLKILSFRSFQITQITACQISKNPLLLFLL